MAYDPELHRRRSIRLKGYDYGQSGMYFITICAHDKENIFGEIKGGEMVLNELGKIVKEERLKMDKRFNIDLDEFCIMPNHIHGIIGIINEKENVGATLAVAQNFGANEHVHRAGARPAPTLSDIVGAFKSLCVNKWLKHLKENNINDKRGGIWQRNYYEHIIRNEKSLDKIRQYIFYNAAGWYNDIENSEVYKNISENDRKKYYQNIV